ncbi:MAG: restriction endonuclease subunit S [Muribaculaceae bacterium]|nr:restriction endonuclease subunit S [Muribaculaceae bacterium]
MKQRYDSYKPSGIDWIGEIPSHWNMCRIKDCFFLKTGTTPKGFDKPINDDEINWFTPSDIESTGSILISAERKLSKILIDQEGISVYPKRSLIFVGIGATAGKLGYAEVEGYSNQQITALIPKNVCSKFYFYYLCQDSKRVRDNASYTTLPIINNSYLSQVYWVMPPLTEQEAIAAWLDEKCGEIDAAIIKVNREIELIDELKQSEISRVVTHGLNPDAPLRPSGIDWIGEIPEHWDSCRLKHKATITLGKMLMSECPKGQETLYTKEKYLKSRNIGWLKLDLNEVEEMWFNVSEKELYELHNNDIVVNEGGEIGKVAIWTGNNTPHYIQNSVHKVSLNIGSSRFFMYWLFCLSKNNYFWSIVSQVSIAHLTKEKLSNAPILFPPPTEQQAIADFLDKRCAEIDGLKAKLIKKRDTLKELRQSIISEVVTGKRKVI